MPVRPILSSLRQHKLSVALIVIEIALTCMIAVNAAFAVSRMLARTHTQSGVAEKQLVVIVASQGVRHTSADKARTAETVAALRTIPGVKAATAVNQIPFQGGANLYGIRLTPTQNHSTLAAAAYEGYDVVGTLGVTLVEGRNFTSAEYIDSSALNNGTQRPATTIITRALAQRLWPGEEALGKTLYIGFPVRVVGIAANLINPSRLGGAAAQWSMILPVRMTTPGAIFVLRTAPDQRARVLAAAVAKLKRLDPKRIFLGKTTLEHVRSRAFQAVRSNMHVMAVVIASLLLVTALGIVGLASFWVGQRRHMIGIRRALGATRRDVLWYFQAENFLIVTVGIVVGLILAYGLSLILMSHSGGQALPWTYAPIAAAVLWLLGQLAVLAPALRASRVPPAVATRNV